MAQRPSGTGRWLSRSGRPPICWVSLAAAHPSRPVSVRTLASRNFRPASPGEEFQGLADLEVRGLPERDARTPLPSAGGFGLDERVRDQVLAEANGNPLALLELPRRLDPAQLAAGLGLPEAQAVPARIEQDFRQRLRRELLASGETVRKRTADTSDQLTPQETWRGLPDLGCLSLRLVVRARGLRRQARPAPRRAAKVSAR